MGDIGPVRQRWDVLPLAEPGFGAVRRDPAGSGAVASAPADVVEVRLEPCAPLGPSADEPHTAVLA